jgi:hypothetical protein
LPEGSFEALLAERVASSRFVKTERNLDEAGDGFERSYKK